MRITVIGGGNMGGAIARGAVGKAIVSPECVTVSDPSQKIKEIFTEFNPKINLEEDNAKAIAGADIIVVAVKPWLMEIVLGNICNAIDRKSQMVVSIAAGVTFENLMAYLKCDTMGDVALYRVIPNTAITLGESTTFVCHHNTSEVQDAALMSLLNALGRTFVVNEDQMVAVTALSSCGIAYIYKYIDAAIKGGVEMGVEEVQAREIVLQTVRGALAMLEHNNTMPQIEIDKVTTPGGITLKGLEEMERLGFTNAVVGGLKASK